MQRGVSCHQISGQLVKLVEHSPACSIQHYYVCCRPTLILHEMYRPIVGSGRLIRDGDWWKLFRTA